MMFDQIIPVITIVVDSFLPVWSYVLMTIPLAVAVQLSGAAKYINRALRSKPITAILLAGLNVPCSHCGEMPTMMQHCCGKRKSFFDYHELHL
jgi:hypothetical protein